MGRVVRRTIKRTNESGKEFVTYSINAGYDIVAVQEWEPTEMAQIGDQVSFKCQLRAYTTKSGAIATMFVIFKES